MTIENPELRLAAVMERLQAEADVDCRQAMSRLAGLKVECTEEFLAGWFGLGFVQGVGRATALLEKEGLIRQQSRTPGMSEVVQRYRLDLLASVEVFGPEDGGQRGLRPISVIYVKGEFFHIRVDGDLVDDEVGESLEAWVTKNGDECWATLEDHRGGPTLSLRELAAEAARLSVAS